MDEKVRREAEIVWGYMQLAQPVGPADCLLVLGSRDDRVAAYAATLATSHRFGTIVVSGGIVPHTELIEGRWGGESEAVHFCKVMRQGGVTQEILQETEALNTGQNATLSYELLKRAKYEVGSVLLVTKPYMERRAMATFEAQWPDRGTDIRVTSAGGTLTSYVNDEQPLETTVSIMVGDLQRIMEYPGLGYQSAQHVPERVRQAYLALVAAGFTQHLIKAKS